MTEGRRAAAAGGGSAGSEPWTAQFGFVPVHPFVLALIPVLGVFGHNADRMALGEIVVPAAVALGATAAAFAALRALTGSARKAGILAALAVVLVGYYEIGFIMATAATGGRLTHEVFVVVWVLVLAAALWGAARLRGGGVGFFTFALNVLSVCIAAIFVFNIATYQLITASKRPAEPAWATPELPRSSLPPGPSEPDVYYLVFDRYAAADVLAEVYGFDNTPFLDALRRRGFYVAANSTANYQRTSHSLASSLTLGYLDHLTPLLGADSDDSLPLFHMLEDYKVWRFLKGRDYRFVHFGSWWDATMENRFADENHNWRAIPELYRVLLDITLVGRLGDLLGLHAFDYRAHHCERVRRKFAALGALPEYPEKTYAFAHVMLPHPPFVFDRDGRCMTVAEAESRRRARNYAEHVEFLNGLILDLVDRILERSARPPVIVLQSDEGPWPAAYAGDEFGMGRDTVYADWTQATTGELREKIRIFNAYYLPGSEPPPLNPGITPVNTFRIVFNRYYGTDLPLLPDRSYIYVDPFRLYEFVEVTDRVK